MKLSETIDDFRRNWQNTFVLVQSPETGEVVLNHIDDIERGSETGVIHMSSLIHGKTTINIGSHHVIKFAYPPVGVFQYGKKALVLRRNPERQYIRGISSRNVLISYPHSGFTGRRLVEGLSLKQVSAAFLQQRYSPTVALDMLKSGHESVALPNNFSLVQPWTDHHNSLFLFSWTTLVARIHNSSKEIQEMYLPEMRDMVGGLLRG